MAGLSQRDMDVIADYAKAGNRELYFNYLAQKDGSDGYGLLALGVVRNDNAPGATANHFAQNQARKDGLAYGERDWQEFGVELMRNDVALRQAQFAARRPDLALNLPVKDIQTAHDLAFDRRDINPDAWTPRQLLEEGRAGPAIRRRYPALSPRTSPCAPSAGPRAKAHRTSAWAAAGPARQHAPSAAAGPWRGSAASPPSRPSRLPGSRCCAG
mgnify:CR=1 FL=1